MDIEPLAIPAVPDPGLLRLAGARPALPIDVLGEADVGDARGILSDHVDVWVQDGGVNGLAVLGQDCGGAGQGELGRKAPARALTLPQPALLSLTLSRQPLWEFSKSPIHFQRPGNLITLVSVTQKEEEGGNNDNSSYCFNQILCWGFYMHEL